MGKEAKGGLVLLVLITLFVALAAADPRMPRRRQKPTPTPVVQPTPTPTPVPVDDAIERVIVIDVTDLEGKVKELHREGYHVTVNNVLLDGGGKAIIFVDGDSMNFPDKAEEQDDSDN